MSARIGSIGWIDLTVPDADRARDFYRDVVGAEISEVDMGGYSDYCLHPPGGDPVAGVCHARGVNADLPPVWLVYFVVADLDAAMERVRAGGGEVVRGPNGDAGSQRIAVVRDPAGALSALYEAPR